ncbi:hypothetical protein WR25_01933 [Diploscapter pachys]|uniref:Uncharacterized protein n=1 Tax=Diploscapter pachys TaxID=2018661 RepID=A0A2A2KFA8_9BILA|nr:hypothetical protein WR25_01933 [Diploscapter pachys]
MARIDEAVGGIARGAEAAGRAVPHLHFAPVAGRRDVDRANVALDRAGARPVGVGEEHFAIADDPRHHRDMADAHAAGGLEGEDRTDLRRVAAFVPAGGLAPPGVGVAVDVDARDFASIGRALPELRHGRGGHHQAARYHQRKTRCQRLQSHLLTPRSKPVRRGCRYTGGRLSPTGAGTISAQRCLRADEAMG